MGDLSKGCANIYPVHDVYIFKSQSSKDSLTICDHDFDEVLNTHTAKKTGWDGFLLQYHCFFPWEEMPWKIENTAELIELISSGIKNIEVDSRSKTNCISLIEFLNRMKEANEKITIEKV